MTDFLRNLPKPKRRPYEYADGEEDGSRDSETRNDRSSNDGSRHEGKKSHGNRTDGKNQCYEYLKRKYLRITCNDDFQGGGAYPEIHVNQYPNNLGLPEGAGGGKGAQRNIVLKYLDEDNNVKYDNLISEDIHIYNKEIEEIEPNENIQKIRKKKILSDPKDKEEKFNELAISKPNEEEEKEIINNTRKSIEQMLHEKLNKSIANKKEDKFFRYIPQNKLNANLEERIIKVVHKTVDPLDVSKFKHKKLPNVKNSPDYPLLRSPTRKINKEEEDNWKIPPCVSNWKNNKGYNIPLDKRIQSDNKKLNQVEVNENFAHLSEYLYVAEKKAREEIKMRNSIIKQKKLKEKEEKENVLRNLAIQARKEKGLAQTQSSSIINERKREIERDYRIEKNLKKMKNYENRLIEEQLALNKVNVSKNNNIHDVSLFNINNQNDDGKNQLSANDDELYQIYDTSLFNAKQSNNIYKFSNERVKKTLQKMETTQSSSEPVKFIKDISDPFGLDSLLSQAKKK
ncbi:pre-mRNA-processing protein 45, putative [Plasmodium knowlesi strain H]|uniref:Pre-mRNA-processing protein 45, putative n=3 Tax=Plasmodium knowlesi TaxID=5850 RepID=A0A5K1V6C4_PLAKH|nr:pre-mRNA-processing protein 45, putative [Plasmodium knowlesi strain H]OTN66748.1 putative Chromatin-binding protein [Plasmodium knowlesi]CAA9986662.1 pre-mRNA-processing protein 45, putative [Plasmodium knowlesi strain H]SBO23468.1 pre-mRNA-processing protein 45, putative [Plasmodium knowlesi strain H]SBO24924.1 pre-mRNA-processing protein 45, putative [Plasmodium knowlesi strain H]VVS76136.1 pre-mRNA-processing protein 45, putative [Plasmodium knowlesi strain H]|eukprot:XP_002257848.1 chromatin-binding protein, putative [Plasmodium knowlesi strain H]